MIHKHTPATRLLEKRLMARTKTRSPMAFLEIGNAYDSGERIPQHYKKSAAFYVKAATSGNRTVQDAALYRLAEMAMNGQGLPQNAREAAKLFKQVAHSKSVFADDALHNLAVLKYYGAGTLRDRPLAQTYFLKLAQKGHVARVGEFLGELYLTGDGGTQDTAEAKRWFGRAAQAGDAACQWQLAMLTDSEAERLKLLKASAKQGFPRAKEDLKDFYNIAIEYLALLKIPDSAAARQLAMS